MLKNKNTWSAKLVAATIYSVALVGCMQNGGVDGSAMNSSLSGEQPGFAISLLNMNGSSGTSAMSKVDGSASSSSSGILRTNLYVKNVELSVSRDNGTQKKAILNLRGNQQVQCNHTTEPFNLPLAKIEADENLKVHKIKLSLDEANSYIILENGQKCELDKSSSDGQNIFIDFADNIYFQNKFLKMVDLKMDIERSVIRVGHDECHFKPYIRMEVRHHLVHRDICKEKNKHDSHHIKKSSRHHDDKVSNDHDDDEDDNEHHDGDHDDDDNEHHEDDDDDCGKEDAPTTTVPATTTTVAPTPTTVPATTTTIPATTTTVAPTTTTVDPTTPTTFPPNTCPNGAGEIFFDPTTGNAFWLCF